MKIYHLLAGGLNPIDYVLIAAAVAVTLLLIVIIAWRKAKGKGGCDCGSCQGCPSAQTCKGNCGDCTVRKDHEEHAEE